MTDLLLTLNHSPGDECALTAVVESLHRAYPGEYRTHVRGPSPAVWANNPRLTRDLPAEPERTLDLPPPWFQGAAERGRSFLAAYCDLLAEKLGRPVPLAVDRPLLYLSQAEEDRQRLPPPVAALRRQPFWLVNAGVKRDITAKGWPLEHYQAVVDGSRGWCQWVQVGGPEADHDHPRLAGVIDLVGQTSHRQLIALAFHAQGGLGPVSYLAHLCAAWRRPYLCLAGGREPPTWLPYATQTTFHTLGSLDCCRFSPCGALRTVALPDGDQWFNSKLCDRPNLSFARPAPQCLAQISPREVLLVLERMLACLAG